MHFLDPFQRKMVKFQEKRIVSVSEKKRLFPSLLIWRYFCDKIILAKSISIELKFTKYLDPIKIFLTRSRSELNEDQAHRGHKYQRLLL